MQPDRRSFLASAALAAAAPVFAADAPKLRVAVFAADITPPLGHPCMGGGIAPVKEVVDPVEARGFVLLPADARPIVVCVLDWCEVRNDAYDAFVNALAAATGTDPSRVMVSSVHQHDTPVADFAAQKLLEAAKSPGNICDIEFVMKAVAKTADAAKESLAKARPATHVSASQAKVEQVASNRRREVDGKPRFDRMSATRDPAIRDAPEGVIDPMLKLLAFYEGDKPIVELSVYATHPMSFYGRGGVTADFVGAARRMRTKQDPAIHQIYGSGCSGNVTAGKYNDGNPLNRPVLAERMHRAMLLAHEAAKPVPVDQVAFRSVPMHLPARTDAGFSEAELRKGVAENPRPFGRCLAALGVSRLERIAAKRAIDVPCLDLGSVCLLLLPAEAYVEYQLLAQKMRPDAVVLTLGYGECGPGYIPTEKHWEEGDGNLRDWCWVGRGSEKVMTEAIRAALGAK